MKLHIAFALLVLFHCVSCGGAISFTNWLFGFRTNAARSDILYRVSSVPGQGVPYGQRSVDSWSNFFVGAINAPSGGIDFSASQQVHPSYRVLTQSNSVSGLDLTTTLRIDDAGWEVVLWELYNPAAWPVTYTLSNGPAGDIKSSGANTITYDTSSGFLSCDEYSSWCVSYYDASGSVGPNFPVLITSFGEYRALDSLSDIAGIVAWTKDVTIQPYDTVGFLEVLGVQNPLLLNVLPASASIANNALASASALYTYTAANGRLLAHLNDNQLLNVINWDFAAAGVGGDPHGLNFDGSHFELPNSPSVYCLFSTRDLQVNIEVGSYGLVTQVVVFARAHRRELHANVVDGFPQYFVGHRPIDVPENLNESIFTAEAPFHFQRSPLKELERYHVNSLVLRGAVTIVGGVHPVMGAFFNVAVHTRTTEVDFPSILQLPNHPQRDLGFAASQIDNVWFDLAN